MGTNWLGFEDSNELMKLPQIIQGGMGIGISDWRLARSVATQGQLGVVSGTVLDLLLVRRLQQGDPGGHTRRALAALPIAGIADDIIGRYFIADGKPTDKPYKGKPMVGHKPTRRAEELLLASNFVEVYLAKEGHDGVVGINFLNKIQAPMLPSIYGAMLAGVDVIIVGAGIPLEIPPVISHFIEHQEAELSLPVRDAKENKTYKLTFNPQDILDGPREPLKRPLFFPIVSSVVLATILAKKCKGHISGFIIEAPTAGGHNAPPRGQVKISAEGEPIYGPRDEVDFSAIKAIGLPFWLAGSYGSPEKFTEAREAGAEGVQIGTLFAFCEESGLRADVKSDTVKQCQTEVPQVFTDPVASPTGFPFKVLTIDGTLSEKEVYDGRRRLCDLGYLREAYEREDGSLGWRCPAEETDKYLKKGGSLEETLGRKCLCNALMANLDMGQRYGENLEELPLVTCGDDLWSIRKLLSEGQDAYTAVDVINFLLSTRTSE